MVMKFKTVLRPVATAARKELESFSSATTAQAAQRFFKTGEGTYGFGDKFIGVSMPNIRAVAKKHFEKLSLYDAAEICYNSAANETRCFALVCMVNQVEAKRSLLKKKSGKSATVEFDDSTLAEDRSEYFEAYLELAKNGKVNNWNLVDASAPSLVRFGLEDKTPKARKDALVALAKTKDNLWVRRIAVVGCWHLIRDKSATEIFALVPLLLNDQEDLIHKACGWMLREVGRCHSEEELIKFLDKYAAKMPAVMLSYSVERLTAAEQKHYKQLRKDAVKASTNTPSRARGKAAEKGAPLKPSAVGFKRSRKD